MNTYIRPVLGATLLLAITQSLLCAEDPPRNTLPEIGKELSDVEGVSIIRKPFQLFGSGSASGSGGGDSGEYSFSAKQIDLRGALDFASPVPRTRFFAKARLPGGRYDISVTAKDQAAAFSALADVYEKVFSVRAVHEKREMEALVLESMEDRNEIKAIPKLESYRGFPTGGSSRNGIDMRGTMTDFAEELELQLREPVVCDVDSDAAYHFEIKLGFASKRADLDSWLGEHGLQLTKQPQAIEGVFVEPLED